MSRYSGEVGISDEISSRLRETTPSLFSQNDAVCSKANELVAVASATEAKYDQLNQLRESVKVRRGWGRSLCQWVEFSLLGNSECVCMNRAGIGTSSKFYRHLSSAKKKKKDRKERSGQTANFGCPMVQAIFY